MPPDACDIVEAWQASPSVVVPEPTTRHTSVLRGLLQQSGSAGNLTTHAHLAALCVEHGGSVVTFDWDFGRFGVPVIVPAS
jgi:predicted nucleic acid-binding protein